MCVVPMYLGEIAPPNLRGTLGTCNQLGCVIGILLSQVLSLPVQYDHTWWRPLLALSAVPSIFQLLFAAFFFYESPRWLLSVKHNRTLATTILRKLRGYKEVDVEM